MPCTTILVGKKASNDGSTMIARTDDGGFDVKKLWVVTPEKQPRKYKSVIGHLTVELPDDPLRHTEIPNVDLSGGLWPAAGINSANVGMTATETITSNPRVLAADPLVRYEKAKSKKEKDVPGGIGEEDLVALVLPYIKSAREGVERLGSLLEQYGTYEMNGIGFNDENEVWWLESIGGHHWIARKVADDEVVVMPNQFGLDRFDMKDAYGEKKNNLCSKDLKDFVKNNHLDLNIGNTFNPRNVFGSHSDTDHIYNTPRAWFMGRYLCPTKFKWDGPDADFTPESDNIPWSFKPERKVTVEDVKYMLSSYYQGTPYDPYAKDGKHIYRTITKNNNDDMAICQIRGDKPEAIKGIEWVSFGATNYNTLLPVYPNVSKLPDYLSKVTTDVSTDNFYWNSRMLGALVDPHHHSGSIFIERYQMITMTKARAIIAEYDEKIGKKGDEKVIMEANEKLAKMMKEETQKTLNQVFKNAMTHMKNGFSRGDN